VVAEGVVLEMDPNDVQGLAGAERDAHGHVRLSEIDLGDILKHSVMERLRQLGIKSALTSKEIGYELRCADPIPFDMEYTRDLGYSAAKYLLEGGDKVMVSMQGGRFVPIPFPELIDPQTGRARVRLVDIHSTRYGIARRYMIRLRRDDFEHPELVRDFARTAGLSVEDFRKQFEYLTENEPPALVLPMVG